MSKKQKGVAKEIRKTERVLTTLGLTPERRWVETLRQDNREAYSQLQSLTHLISTHHDDTVAVGSLFRLRAGGDDADEMAVTAVASEASGCRRLCDRPRKEAGPVYSDLSTRKLCKWATAHLTTADKQTKKTVRAMKLAQLLYWMLHCEQIHNAAAAEADATQRCGGLIVVDEKHQRAYYLTSDQASLRMGPVFAMRLPVTSAETNLAMMQKTVTALRELVAGLRATAEATVTKKRPRREPRPKETLVYVEVSEGEEDSECETLGSVDTDDGSDGEDGYDDCAVMSDDDDASFAEYSDEDDADDSGTSAADSESDSESVSDRY